MLNCFTQIMLVYWSLELEETLKFISSNPPASEGSPFATFTANSLPELKSFQLFGAYCLQRLNIPLCEGLWLVESFPLDYTGIRKTIIAKFSLV